MNRLSQSQWQSIRRLIENGWTISFIAKSFNVSRNSIYVKKRQWDKEEPSEISSVLFILKYGWVILLAIIVAGLILWLLK